MTSMPTIRLWSAILVAVASVACSSITDPSKNTSETFSGQVQPNSYGQYHPITISNSGELTVVVNSIIPGSTFLAVAYGQVSGASCAVQQQNAVSSANLGKTVITAQLTNKGTYCVQAFDPSLLGLGLPALVVGQNYTLTVSHP
jgi:hypothetical protein